MNFLNCITWRTSYVNCKHVYYSWSGSYSLLPQKLGGIPLGIPLSYKIHFRWNFLFCEKNEIVVVTRKTERPFFCIIITHRSVTFPSELYFSFFFSPFFLYINVLERREFNNPLSLFVEGSSYFCFRFINYYSALRISLRI